MPKGHFIQNSLNGGEWSPLLSGRTDLAKYGNSLSTLKNFVLYPHGPATFRPGFRYIKSTKDSAKKSRLIPFQFSVTQAYQLEFGHQYIRFYKDQSLITLTAQNITNITKANPAVVTYSGSDTYSNGDKIIIAGVLGMVEVNNREFTVANVNVGANTFELSGVNSSAYSTYSSGGTVAEVYEIASPYTETDIDGLDGFFQSADVLYLPHANYAPRKLSRTGHTSWTLSIINFLPMPMNEAGIKPATTLTLAATTGQNISFTTGAAAFLSGDVGRLITSGVGKASIVTFVSTTEVLCDIIDDFAAVGPIASQSWSVLGSPNGTITPSIKEPKGAICTLTSTSDSAESATYTDLLDTVGGNWSGSGSGTNEYYLLNTAAFYQASKPTRLYIDGVLTVEGIVGTLGIIQWDYGDNDTLGYNTVYVRLADGANPDSKSTALAPDNDFVQACTVTVASGTPKDVFRSTDVGSFVRVHSGIVQITAYTSVTDVKGEILKELSAVTPAASWTLETASWNSTNGYPVCGTFFEERMVLAGSAAYPETVWGSVSGDYENFSPGTADSDAFTFTLSGKQVNTIRWVEPDEYLMVGANSQISRLGPDDTGAVTTPLNVKASRQSGKGCADIAPVVAGETVLYVQRTGKAEDKGKKIRELVYSWEQEKYVTADLTQLAEHLTTDKISQIVYQEEPFSIVWARTATGKLLGMTYLRGEEVVGWHQHPIDGEVESLSVIPGDGYDELWIIIKRTINGQVVRYVEMMEAYFDDDAATYTSNKGLNAFFLDCGLTYNGASTLTVSGLWHLEGETVVAVLADGSTQSDKTVSGGKITLTKASTVVHVGKKYTGTIITQRMEAPLADGTAQGREKRIIDMTIRVVKSGPFKAGRDETHLDAMFDRNRQLIIGGTYPLFTGDIRTGIEGEWGTDGKLVIVQDKPMPLTVAAIIPETSIS